MGLRERLAALEAPNRRTVERTTDAAGWVRIVARSADGTVAACVSLPPNGRESMPFPMRRAPL